MLVDPLWTVRKLSQPFSQLVQYWFEDARTRISNRYHENAQGQYIHSRGCIWKGLEAHSITPDAAAAAAAATTGIGQQQQSTRTAWCTGGHVVITVAAFRARAIRILRVHHGWFCYRGVVSSCTWHWHDIIVYVKTICVRARVCVLILMVGWLVLQLNDNAFLRSFQVYGCGCCYGLRLCLVYTVHCNDNAILVVIKCQLV